MSSKPTPPPPDPAHTARQAAVPLHDCESSDPVILSSLDIETPDITPEEMDVIEQYLGAELDVLLKQWLSATPRRSGR